MSNKRDGRFSFELQSRERPLNIPSSDEAGAVVSKRELLTLTCRTVSGLKLTCHKLYPHPIGLSSVEFQPAEIAFETENTNSAGGNLIVGLVNAFRDTGACCCTSPLPVEFHRGAKGSNRKGFVFEHKRIVFALGATQGGYREFKAWTDAQASFYFGDQAMSFLHALSFYVGERVSWLGFDSMIGAKRRIVLKQPLRKIAPLLQSPRAEEIEHATEKKLLACAFNFFSKPENLPVVNWLAMLWDNADCFHPVQCLVAVTVLEGIVLRTADHKLDEDTKRKVKKLKSKVQKLVRTNWPELSSSIDPLVAQQFLKGIQDSIGGAQQFSVREVILRAAQERKIGVSKKEIKAWKQLRDPLAHGNYGKGWRGLTEIRRTSWQHDCALNLIYKFVFGLIRYRGPYTDFSARGWPGRKKIPRWIRPRLS